MDHPEMTADLRGQPLGRRLESEGVARRLMDGLASVLPGRKAKTGLDLPAQPRVGILLQWGIGDAVLTLPLLTGLRSALPDARIALIGKPWIADLFHGTGLADETFDLVPPWTRHSHKYTPGAGAWRRFIRQLRAVRKEDFDLVISCRFDARDMLQLHLLRTRFRAGYGDAGGAGWLDLDLGTPPSREIEAPVHRDAAYALTRITGTAAPAVPAFPADPNAAEAAMARLIAGGFDTGPVVAVSVSAGHPIRRWGSERFGEVLRQAAPHIGFLVHIRDPGDVQSENLVIPEHVPAMEWSGSLDELRALLQVTDLVLCCDSGVMHMASASGTPVIAIFGAGSPQWYGPYNEHDRVILKEPMPCRPCFDRCIYAEPICLNGVSVSMVSSALEQALTSEVSPERRAR